MSLDMIKKIKAAEEEGREAVIAAREKARKTVDNAEEEGAQALALAHSRAETEIAELMRECDQQAAEIAHELVATTANRQAMLRARGEVRIEKAASLIVERIMDF
ncbi:MAG: hypothetical protein FWC96_06010 [Oscillospiraceae bacterium]|nr:hypothetical protein [Oscillospiraceae bacterium]